MGLLGNIAKAATVPAAGGVWLGRGVVAHAKRALDSCGGDVVNKVGEVVFAVCECAVDVL
jgi:hypothetical protein